ncbi:MAG: DUF3108 domain-containing protein, partial [Sulfurimonas sp.]|nr:DUF3108 domain-containing protein [Sulfurimonas sp.]
MKIVFFLFLFVSSFFAYENITRYDVYATLFGHVGYCDVHIKEDGKNYEINVVAQTIDAAALLLQGRVESFQSKGIIKDGRYIPKVFIKTKKTTKRTRVQTYTFNHEKKEVLLVEEKIKLVNKTRFDSQNFRLVTREVEEKSRKDELLDPFVADDTLSIYLGSRYGCNGAEKKHLIFAVGAHNDKNNIHYECLTDKKKTLAQQKLQSSADTLYNLHVEPLDKDEKVVDALLAYDKDGLLQEGLMDEIFWVGSMRAVRVSHKILN